MDRWAGAAPLYSFLPPLIWSSLDDRRSSILQVFSDPLRSHLNVARLAALIMFFLLLGAGTIGFGAPLLMAFSPPGLSVHYSMVLRLPIGMLSGHLCVT